MTNDLNLMASLVCSFVGGLAFALIMLAFGYGLLGASVAYSLGGTCVLILCAMGVAARFAVLDDEDQVVSTGQ